MAVTDLGPEDIRQIEKEGLNTDRVEGQIEKFLRGTTPVSLVRPCIPGDGVLTLTDAVIEEQIDRYDASRERLKVMKFVPASGAATRMFREWFSLLDADPADMGRGGASRVFMENIQRYAFSTDLDASMKRRGSSLEACLGEGRTGDIIRAVLMPAGLNYGYLPKALLAFHRYDKRNRTALEEHFVEAAGYGKSGDGVCRIHFTVSEEFLPPVRRHIEQAANAFGTPYGATFEVGLSVQKPSTNTLAVDMDNRPFRDDRGRLVFRPGGHGALLDNLNDLDADLVFIKNIDNVCHARLLGETIRYKKVLAGYLLQVRETVFRYLEILSSNDVPERAIPEIEDWCRRSLQVHLPPDYPALSGPRKVSVLIDTLNRPIRVCGMVKNTGEPGGGPFWVEDDTGGVSRQIIEAFQVDGGNEEQVRFWRSSTHFNPVDLVCSLRDFRGGKFDLHRYADQDAVCISVKSEKGRSLKALELPGLWNGSMSRWITLFLEVPIVTFNPVKTVEDLLRVEHLPG
ncbi:MAG: DUF4301 family protein [Deltaproteobacteria bacterium]|nr:DUF4301 family protein [Deltaproteobacteria bacterium]